MCGLKPCTGCNSRVLTVNEIKSYFSGLAQKRKQDARTKSKEKKSATSADKKKKAVAKKKTSAPSKMAPPGAKHRKAGKKMATTSRETAPVCKLRHKRKCRCI